MELPENLHAQLRCATPDDLSGLILEIRVTTGTKNPYYILFPKTDADGRAALSRSEFLGQFHDHWESGLMDYQGDVADASSTVEVALFDAERYRANEDVVRLWPLLKHERTKWASRREAFLCL